MATTNMTAADATVQLLKPDRIEDSIGGTGVANSFLSSDGTSLQWKVPTGLVALDIDQVLQNGDDAN